MKPQPTLTDSLTKTFLDLIKINEIYDQEKVIISYCQKYFDKLKIPHRLDSFNNFIAYLPGTGDPILLNTHLDIPESAPDVKYEIKGDILKSNGDSILGADPKSGLAILLELAKHIIKNKIKTHPIEFVFTRGEEAGLYGALNLNYKLLKSKIGLVLDEDGPCTNVVIKAPAFYRIDCKFIGLTSHSRDWRDGKNALAAMANAIAQLQQGEINPGVTFNIGIMHAGTARNSVAGEAELKAELRSFSTAKVKSAGIYVEKVLNKTARKFGCKVVMDSALEFEGYSLKRNHPLFKRLTTSYKVFGMKENYYETFGGSDANVINSHGIRCVPIGSGYFLAHQYQEYINLSDMEKAVHFLTEFTTQP